MSDTDCDCAALRAELECLRSDVDKLWDETFGEEERVFILTGGTGAPCQNDQTANNPKFVRDAYDYTNASALISTHEPSGIFLLGGGNFDFLSDGLNYDLYRQEAKVLSGFNLAYSKRALYPVMGDVDYFPTVATCSFFPPVPGSGDEQKFNQTWMRFFPYLSDAKRYYSVYDDKSETEFFILSSGRYADVSGVEAPGFWPYAMMDAVVGAEQHTWFVARATASQAKNKVVLFHHPFVSLPTAINGTGDNGEDHLVTDFSDWDFESVGVRLIVNGHSGYAYHLRKGAMHIVNASTFARSRISAALVGSAVPRDIPTPIGQSGWAVEYSSVANPEPSAGFPNGYLVPSGGDPVEDYVTSKTEFIKLNCRRDGITVEHWSYDLVPQTFSEALASLKLEHSFELSAV